MSTSDLTDAKGRLVGVQAIFYSRPGGMGPTRQNDKYRLSPSLNYVAAFDYFRPEDARHEGKRLRTVYPRQEPHLLSNGHKYRIYAQPSLYSDPGKKGEFLAESDFPAHHGRPHRPKSPPRLSPTSHR